MKYLLALMVMALLAGCQSDVDKCVAAEMKAWKISNDEKIKNNNELDKYNDEVKKNNDAANALHSAIVEKCMVGDDSEKWKKCFDENPGKEWKQYFGDMRYMGTDKRPVEVVEAEKRLTCMRATKGN